MAIANGTPVGVTAEVGTTFTASSTKAQELIDSGTTTGTMNVKIITESEAAAGIEATSSALGDTISNIDYENVRKAASNSNGMDGGSGNSYANRGEHWVRGHYSREDEKGHIAMELERLIDDTTDEQIRNALKQALRSARD